MEILIKNHFSSDELISRAKIKWRLFSKNRWIWTIVIFLLGFIPLIVLKLIDSFDTEESVDSALLIALIILSVFNMISLIKTRRKYFKQVLSNDLSGDETELKLNDEKVIFRSPKIYQEINWSYFMTYTPHNNYLLLNSGDNSLSSIMIHKHDLTDIEFQKLKDFVKSKLVLMLF